MAGMTARMLASLLGMVMGMGTGLALAQGGTEADLLRSARMWTAKNRPDLARQQLTKLLASNPDSPDAQVLLADLALRENKLAEAQKILNTLRQRHFQHPATRDLEQLVRIYGPEREKLARMRLLSRGGNKAEAQALARELFPQGPPTVGGLDIEYYQLMASTTGGGVQAQKQLQRLYRETGDARYRLAQLESQVQAGNLSSATLSEFESLAQRADVNQPALQDVWRRAISRLPTNRASMAWIHAYLRWIPGERAMLEKLAEMEAMAKAGTLPAGVEHMAATRAAGRKALDREENDAAEKQWLAVLAARPTDAEAQGSLGLVRLRQKRYAEAQEHFTRAHQRDPQQKWADLKKTAMVWGGLQMADTALANGDTALALAHAQQALELEPKNTSALRALAGVHAKDGKPAQGLALLEKAYQDDPELASGLVDIRVDLMREQASMDTNANRTGAALRMLETAVPLQPDNPWLRHQLARLYMQLNMPEQALDVMHEGVARAGENPEMRFARALVLAALDDPAAALLDLQSVAAAQRSAAMQTLEERVTVDLYIRQASSSGMDGLREVENMVGNDPDLLYAVANAWFRHGLPHQGVAVYDRLAQRVVPLPPQAQLNHAVLRNRAQDDAALEQQLPGLLQLPDWTAAQEAELLQLTSAHRERLIERLLASQPAPQAQQAQELARQPMPFQAGQRSPQLVAQSQREQARLLLMVGAFAEASVLLERALPALAQDVDLRLELGDTYYRTGRLDEALVQLRWLQANSDTLKPYQQLALVRLLQNTGKEALAGARAQWLLQRYPDDLDVVLYAARQERSNGEYARALALFQRAYQIALAQGNTANTANTATGTITDTLRLQLAYNLAESGIGADETRIASDGPDAATLALRFLGAMESTAGAAGAVGVASPLGTLEKIQADVDAIEDRRQAWVEVGLEQRERVASEGRSTLHGWEQPLVVMLPWRYDGRVFLHLDQVALDAGSLPDDVREFGQLAAWSTETIPRALIPQTARGLNLGIGYEGDSLRWDLGSVGQGFPVSNIVGGLRQSGDIGPLGYSLELARRPMTGTLLSYAGARDPVTGAVWGGVVATSVGGRVSADVGAFGLSASTSFAVLNGRNVDDNQRFAWRLALDRDLYRSTAQQLNLGMSVSGVQFARDLSGFTWGHGGYYSPKSSTTLTLPLEWNGRNNAWSWLLRASVSASRSDSHQADYFPGNAVLQSQAQTQGSDPVYAGGGGSLSSGYSLRGVLEYQTSARWVLGARLEREVSDYYTPLNLLFYTRYLFDPVRGPHALQNDGVRPVRAYSSF